MRVRFYVEKRRGAEGKLLTQKRPIFMTVAFNGNRVLISTKKFVDLRLWDSEKQQVREIHPESMLINDWLDSLKYTAGVVWKALVSLSENPGVEAFREEFEKLRPRFSGGFFDVMFMFMEEGSERWSSGSYKKVRTFYNQLKHFEKETNYQIGFDKINADFLNSFQKYQKSEGKGSVTILKMVNTLVWYLNWATKKGYNVYYDYRQFYKMLDHSGSREEKEVLYLDWSELMQIFGYNSEEPRKQRIRDLFCIMCFSGLRFGELSKLQKPDIDGQYIYVRKNGEIRRQVPLHKYSSEIIERYANKYYRNNSALPSTSMVSMNKYLRVIGEDLELNRMVNDPRNVKQKVPLYTLMTAGLGVQTFIFNALRLDIPAELIANYTGITRDQRIKILKQEMSKNEMKKFNNI